MFFVCLPGGISYHLPEATRHHLTVESPADFVYIRVAKTRATTTTEGGLEGEELNAIHILNFVPENKDEKSTCQKK